MAACGNEGHLEKIEKMQIMHFNAYINRTLRSKLRLAIIQAPSRAVYLAARIERNP